MNIDMLFSKIHRATVTDSNLNYIGSITVDQELMEKARLRTNQKVDVVNINNGSRITTYIIPGQRGKREICLNGAAARCAQQGDKVIIIAYATFCEKELTSYHPTVVLVDEKNNPI